MDTKKLALLEKAAIAQDLDSKGRKGAHVPGQGFSEESERFFKQLANRPLPKPIRSEYPVHQEKEETNDDPVIDQVTRELKKQFAALNRIAEIREREAQRRRENAERRAAKAERRKQRQEQKASSPVPSRLVVKKKKKKGVTPVEPAAPKSKWIEKICWRCQAKFVIHVEWQLPPGLCKPCREDLNSTYLPRLGRDRTTKFSYVRIVSGGAPSLGKRR